MVHGLSVERSVLPLCLLIAAIAAGSGCALFDGDDGRSTDERTVVVDEHSETVMQPLPVEEPQQERWRDIAGVAYADGFREAFDYADLDEHRAHLAYEREAATLEGVLSARGLKPSMAYQLKLVGLEPVAGVSEAENADDARTWSSWQLGKLGRWWCEDCQWNLLDGELAEHVEEDHTVRGYLLFDWFVTDEDGNAEHPFALDSSLHVLWRVGQRDRERNDSAPRWYEIERSTDVYPPSAANTKQLIGLYGEWEPDRPPIGQARLPAGSYEVGLNLTEETFHANLGEDRELDGGGFWAWVLQSELAFEVRE